MANRIKASEALKNADMTLEDCTDSVIPACCSEGCEVEPDGECEHGYPSVLIALNMI
jgi:hypothetical protein